MSGVEHSEDVRAPVDIVFAAITDPRRALDWNPNVIEIRDVPGILAPGAGWTQTVSMLGHITHLTCQIVRYEPPLYGEIQVTGDYRARIWTRCEERDGFTRVTQSIDFEQPHGRFKALTGLAARTMIRRELHASMARQRDTLEREAGGVHGSGT